MKIRVVFRLKNGLVRCHFFTHETAKMIAFPVSVNNPAKFHFLAHMPFFYRKYSHTLNPSNSSPKKWMRFKKGVKTRLLQN